MDGTNQTTIKTGDIVTKADAPDVRCRVLRIYPDGDFAHFEVITKTGKRDRRWSANGGFTGSLRWWRKVEPE